MNMIESCTVNLSNETWLDVTFLYFLYPCRKRSMLLPFRVYSFMPLKQWSPSPITITIGNINILSNVDFYVI